MSVFYDPIGFERDGRRSASLADVGPDPFGRRRFLEEEALSLRADGAQGGRVSRDVFSGNRWRVGEDGRYEQDGAARPVVSGGRRWDVARQDELEGMLAQRAGDLSLSVAARRAAQDALSRSVAARERSEAARDARFVAEQDALARRFAAEAAARGGVEQEALKGLAAVDVARVQNEGLFDREQEARRRADEVDARKADREREAQVARFQHEADLQQRKLDAEAAVAQKKLDAEAQVEQGRLELERARAERPYGVGQNAFYDPATGKVSSVGDTRREVVMDAHGAYEDERGVLRLHPDLEAIQELRKGVLADPAIGVDKQAQLDALDAKYQETLMRLKARGIVPYAAGEREALEAQEAERLRLEQEARERERAQAWEEGGFQRGRVWDPKADR